AYTDGLVSDYVATRRSPMDRILWKLRAAGAPLLATLRAEHLATWKGTLLVVHPHLLPDGEWQALMERPDLSIITIGGPAPSEPVAGQRRVVHTGRDAFEVALFPHGKGRPLE